MVNTLYPPFPRGGKVYYSLIIKRLTLTAKCEETRRKPPDSVVPAGHCADARLAGT